jgi:hypothetical protein
MTNEETDHSAEHQQAYENRKAVHKHLLEKAQQGLEDAIKVRPLRIAEYVQRKGIASEDDLEPEVRNRFYLNEKRMQNRVAELQKLLVLMRPPTDKDIEYRQNVYDQLADFIKQNAPADLPLRFHGTGFNNVPDIIFSRQLSSSVDRLGYEVSYDVSDQVSVSTVQSVDGTINSYTHLINESYCFPAGCIFVLLPQSGEEEKAGQSMLMGNVDFAARPGQLFRILCSPETLPIVRQQLSDVGMNPELAQEFFHFAEVELPALKTELEQHPEKLTQLVPYKAG